MIPILPPGKPKKCVTLSCRITYPIFTNSNPVLMPQIISPLVVHSSGHSVSMHTLRSFNNWLIHLVSTLNKSSSAPATIWHFSNPLPSWFPSFAPAVAYQFTSSNAVWRTKYVLAVFSPGQYHFPRSGLYIHTVWDCGRVFFFFFHFLYF